MAGPSGGREYSRFCELFNDAETRIKQVEKLSNEPLIPAINQLRYAAAHLRQSFLAATEAKRLDCIKSAENHCLRAIKDVTEASVDYVVLYVNRLEKEFKYLPLSETIPNHLQIRTSLRKTWKLTIDHTHESIETAIPKLKEGMDDALGYLDIYEAAWPELNKKAIIQRRKAAWTVLVSIGVPVTLALSGWIISLFS